MVNFRKYFFCIAAGLFLITLSGSKNLDSDNPSKVKTISTETASRIVEDRENGLDPLTLSIRTKSPGAAISENALGLSYETSRMLPDSNGIHYFRSDNTPLVTVFKTLGIKSLRIGGNSVDAPKVPMPVEQDVTAFFEFARAAGVKVIYSLRLEESIDSGKLPPSTTASNIAYAQKIAKLIHDRYADVLDYFAIGNEPDYFRDYAVYSAKWKAIHDAIVEVYPDAKFCGPDQNPSPDLDKKMVRDFANASDRLIIITQYSYPFGCSYKNPQDRADITKLIPFDAAESREKMLSQSAYKIYEGIKTAIVGTSVSYRLTESNSFWFSGLKGASDSYASALWGLDYLCWWLGHGALGIDFHTGDRTGGELSMPCRYAAFVTSGDGYEVRPLGYGMKLFALCGYGKQLLVTASSATNLVAYATLENKTVLVKLINKEHETNAKKLAVQIKLDTPLANSKVQIIFLRAKDNDIGCSSEDVTLGAVRPLKKTALGMGNGQL